MIESAPGQRRAPLALIAAIVVALIWLVVAGVALLPAMMAVMMFDAPGSESVFWTQLTAYSMLALPFVAAGCGIASLVPVGFGWWARSQNEPTRAWRATLLAWALLALPLLDVALVIGGFVGLEVFCGGSFSCH